MAAFVVNLAIALFLLLLLVRPSHFDIMRGEKVYLRRYFIINTRWLRVYVHNIRYEDDDRDPHDHPASFFTLVLRGGYTDEEWLQLVRISSSWVQLRNDNPHPRRCLVAKDRLRAGSIRFRRAEHVHRVRDVLPGTWTLTVWGRYRREWGFWDENWNWIHWRKYLGINGEYEGD